MSTEAKFSRIIGENDPETGGHVEMAIYKHQNGGMFAIDVSYLEQVAEENEGFNCYVINDPFAPIGEPQDLYLYD